MIIIIIIIIVCAHGLQQWHTRYLQKKGRMSKETVVPTTCERV